MLNKYKIDGTIYINNPYKEYELEETYPMFEEKILEFKLLLKQQVKNNQSKTYFKFGDGDYYFLTKSKVGSAKPGNRAIKRPYFMINHKVHLKNVFQNDFYCCEIINENQKKFKKIFNKDFDFPAEILYGLISNKWIFQEFSGSIGLIGAAPKIELIRELMSFKEYQEYLGLPMFNDYISIPQKFAVDKFSTLSKDIEIKLKNSKSKIFLLGIGHVKSGLLSQLKNYKNAVFLDIGSGIDAIAGVVDKKKPYLGNWTNYQIKSGFDYSKIDYLAPTKIEPDQLLTKE